MIFVGKIVQNRKTTQQEQQQQKQLEVTFDLIRCDLQGENMYLTIFNSI